MGEKREGGEPSKGARGDGGILQHDVTTIIHTEEDPVDREGSRLEKTGLESSLENREGKRERGEPVRRS